MNREIKFRAWIGDRSVMRDVVTYQKHVKGFSISYLESMGIELEPMYSVTHSIKLMQYTGLKDKYGIEIYEGDIVTAHQFLFDGCEVESQIFGEIAIGDFGVTLKRIKNDFYEDYTGYEPYEGESHLLDFYGLHEDSFEVIGNIYENKELLDDEK